MFKTRFLSMLVLLAAVVTGAWAQTYKVSVKEGTEDATNWTITPAEATTTGVAAGTEVKATYSGTKRVKSVKAVKKAAVPVTAITLNKTATEIAVGQTETLSVTAVAPDNATDKTYTWKTSDETKATVDQDGKVTAVAAGTVTIYAEANDGSGVKGTCAVTVKATLLSLTVSNPDNWIDGNSKTIYYLAGETWRQAIENHAKENAGWIFIEIIELTDLYPTFTGYKGMATVWDFSGDFYPIDSTVIDGTRSYIFAE